MATTYTLGVPTTEDYDLKLKRVPVASCANFAVSSQVSDETSQQVVYTYGAGDAADVFTLVAKRQYVDKKDQTNCSLRISALVKKSVSETGEISYSPVEAVLAWNIPGRYCLDSDFPVSLLSIGMSLIAQELTGVNGTPTSLVIDKFDHNVLTDIIP